MRPPFVLFLTSAFEEAEEDMLKLKVACPGQTLMHLVVDASGRLPRHPRLAEDSFRVIPEAATRTSFGHWTNAVGFQMRNCGLILVDGASMSHPLRTELDLIETKRLQWKTVVLARGALHPEVAARVERWRELGKPTAVYATDDAAALLGRLCGIEFPPAETPVWTLTELSAGSGRRSSA
jgi:hypothetical protein